VPLARRGAGRKQARDGRHSLQATDWQASVFIEAWYARGLPKTKTPARAAGLGRTPFRGGDRRLAKQKALIDENWSGMGNETWDAGEYSNDGHCIEHQASNHRS